MLLYRIVVLWPQLLFDASCLVSGLGTIAIQASESSGAIKPMKCRLLFPGASEDAVKEVLGGSDLPQLNLAIGLQPSTAPASLALLLDGKLVPVQVNPLPGRLQALL